MNLEQPISAVRFAVVDVETTGKYPSSAAITDIAVVPVDDGTIGEPFTSLVNPVQPIPDWITDLTGISDALVADAPMIEQVLPDALDAIGSRVIVAHNAPFDLGFLAAGAKSISYPRIQNPILCTVALGRKLIFGVPNYKLDSLLAHLNIVCESRHRALGDAVATAKLLQHYLSLLPAHGIDTLAQLLAFQDLRLEPAS